MSESLKEGEAKLIHGFFVALGSGNEQPEDMQARLVFLQPLPSLTCSACVASLSDDLKTAVGGEYAYAVNPDMIEIKSIESREDGWNAKGVGEIQQVKCPHCGMIYDAILHAVPICCSSIACPKCHKTEKLSYRIHRIDTAFHQFEFEVEIRCERCKKKRTLKRLIDSLLDVVKIKVSPTGVTVEKK